MKKAPGADAPGARPWAAGGAALGLPRCCKNEDPEEGVASGSPDNRRQGVTSVVWNLGWALRAARLRPREPGGAFRAELVGRGLLDRVGVEAVELDRPLEVAGVLLVSGDEVRAAGDRELEDESPEAGGRQPEDVRLEGGVRVLALRALGPDPALHRVADRVVVEIGRA